MFATSYLPVFSMSYPHYFAVQVGGSRITRLKNNRHVPPVPAQAELLKLLSEEAHVHAWEFDTERISGILSATGKGLSDILVNSAHKALRGKGSLD